MANSSEKKRKVYVKRKKEKDKKQIIRSFRLWLMIGLFMFLVIDAVLMRTGYIKNSVFPFMFVLGSVLLTGGVTGFINKEVVVDRSGIIPSYEKDNGINKFIGIIVNLFYCCLGIFILIMGIFGLFH